MERGMTIFVALTMEVEEFLEERFLTETSKEGVVYVPFLVCDQLMLKNPDRSITGTMIQQNGWIEREDYLILTIEE
jgi:hypothetical protein